MNQGRSYLLAGLSGLLLAVSFPLFGLSYLAWLALVPLLLAIIPGRRSSFLPGLAAGIVFRTISMYWLVPMLHGYAKASWPVSVGAFGLLVLYLSAYTGLFTLVLSWHVERWGPRGLLAAPPIWAAIEFANEHLFTGFHWLPLGASQSAHLRLVQVAEYWGTLGVSFLVVTVNAAFTLAILSLFPQGSPRPSRRLSGVAAGAAVALVLGALLWGDWRINTLERESSSARSLRVRLVNPAVPQDVKWTLSYRAEALKELSRLSRTGQGRVDLIIWPEAAVPFYFEKDPFLSAEIYKLSTELKAPILFGAPGQTVTKEGVAFTNSAFLVAPGGKLLGRYDKRSLVPFGEYVPLGRLLSFVPPVARGLAYAALTPGRGSRLLRVRDAKFGVLICYEAIFGGLVRDASSQGADFLINVTNDAWLGPAGARQHFSMGRFAAIEARLPVVRVANRGVSAVFDPSGRARCVLEPPIAGAKDCSFAVTIDLARQPPSPTR